MSELEELEKYVDDQAKRLAESYGTFPEPAKKDSLLKIFREVLELKEWAQAIKVGFLKKEELGAPKIAMRDELRVARYAKTEGYDQVADYLRGNTLDLAASSLSLKAKLLEQPFTVKRETRSLGTPKETRKRGLFGGETITREGVDHE